MACTLNFQKRSVGKFDETVRVKLNIDPLYEVLLKQSSKGEMRLCSPFLQDMAEEGIRPIEIYELLEEKYPGEVVTRERFYEVYNKILELKFKQEINKI